MGMLRKKVWFTWTLLRLSARYLAGIIFAALALWFAWTLFREGNFLTAIACFTIGVLLLVLVCGHIFMLFHDIEVGKSRELRRRGCCPYCEYDLRASALRCPECGRAIAEGNVEV